MKKRTQDMARAAIGGIGGFFASLGREARGWLHGDDPTLLVVLCVIAVVFLFVLVPNRRRY